MRNGYKTNRKWPGFNCFRPWQHRCHCFVRMAMFIHFATCNIGGERAGIDRRAQITPEMRQSTNMIFVGVRDKNRLKLVTALF